MHFFQPIFFSCWRIPCLRMCNSQSTWPSSSKSIKNIIITLFHLYNQSLKSIIYDINLNFCHLFHHWDLTSYVCFCTLISNFLMSSKYCFCICASPSLRPYWLVSFKNIIINLAQYWLIDTHHAFTFSYLLSTYFLIFSKMLFLARHIPSLRTWASTSPSPWPTRSSTQDSRHADKEIRFTIIRGLHSILYFVHYSCINNENERKCKEMNV